MVVKVAANRKREHSSEGFYMLRFHTYPFYSFLSSLRSLPSTIETRNFLPHQLAHVVKSKLITVVDTKMDDQIMHLIPCLLLRKSNAENILARKCKLSFMHPKGFLRA